MNSITRGAKTLLHQLREHLRTKNEILSFLEAMQFLARISNDKLTVIDVGAASGTDELLTAFPVEQHQHILIEPHSKFTPRLTQLAKHPNVTVHQVVAADRNGEIVFDVHPDAYKATISDGIGSTTNDQTFPCATLDSLLKADQPPAPYLIKIDVEGHEALVLKGATETLKQAHFVVLEGWINSFRRTISTAELFTIMESAGFRLFDIVSAKRMPNGAMKQADYIFIRQGLALPKRGRKLEWIQ